jgi:PAS domain S-box-containing protein
MPNENPDSLRLLESVFTASPDIITVTSLRTGIILEANDEFVKRTGYTREESLGNSSITMGMWVDPERRNQFRAILEAERIVRGFEARLKLRSGEVRSFQISASVVASDDDPTIVSIFRDITDSKVADEQLRKSTFLLERAEEMARIGSWEFDYATKVVTGSEGAARIYGVPRDNLTISVIESVPLPEYRPLLNKARDEHIQQGKPYDIEFRIHRQNDGAVLDVHSRALWDASNKRLFGILQDITEEKRIEAGLRDAIANRDVLINELHHRIYNSLQIVNSLLQLEDEGSDRPSTTEVLSRLSRRVSALAQVHESLYESRNLSRVDVGNFSRRLVSELARNLSSADRLTFNLGIEDFDINIDAAVPCGLVLVELLHNAVAHAHAVGSPGVIQLSARREADGTVFMEVSDEGKGIHFDTGNFPANHLGLRLAKDLVEGQLKGTIDFRNAPGCICTVRFRDDQFIERV